MRFIDADKLNFNNQNYNKSQMNAILDFMDKQPSIVPCTIGSDVYIVPSKVNFQLNILHKHEENNRVYHQKIKKITFTPSGWYMESSVDVEYGTGRTLPDKLYQETWFISESEAQEKLNELQRL